MPTLTRNETLADHLLPGSQHADRLQYDRDGYFVYRELFGQEETVQLREHYMTLRASGPLPLDFFPMDPNSVDPLKRYPRMTHMHRYDPISLQFLLDERLKLVLTALMGREPYAVQTMFYFKPAGSRGQALHQDNYYLHVYPGTCMAAWLALDRCDEENGCMRIVPGSHTLPLLCTTPADTTQSFTDITVPVPESMEALPILMEPGDALFFNGSVIHGSYPNTSADRFRRSLVGHYMAGEAEQIGKFHTPVLRMDGSAATVKIDEGGGPCGVWTERDGRAVVEVSGIETHPTDRYE